MIPNIEKRIETFQEKAFGLFVHYGPYVQYENGEWALKIRQHDPKEYEAKALACDYSSFDANNLIESAKLAGAKYITFTSRHHDGFSLYDTKGLSDYDIMHTPNGKDIIGEFVKACHDNDIMPFIYHTTLDWHHKQFDGNFKEYLKYLRASIEIICTNYGEIGGFWFDGNWSKPDEDWEPDALYGIIRKHQPDAIIINNTGLHEQGVYGHKEIDCVTFEQGSPQLLTCEGMKKFYVGEMCYPLSDHWGIATDINIKSMKQILEAMVSCRRVGGNFLLGIATKIDGSQPCIYKGFLEEIGKWVKMNQDVFYNGAVTDIVGSGNDFVLELEDKLYCFMHDVNAGGDVNVTKLSGPRPYGMFKNVTRKTQSARWTDNGRCIPFTQNLEQGLLFVEPTPFEYGERWIVRVAELA